MQTRGRNRAVSEAARARQASEERLRPALTHRESRSPTPPPTPPLSLSLADQVHMAYAVDDIHLARVLLLRLQGIEVTSDDDPRITAVRDEDFDACFIPFGRLLDDGRGEASSSSNLKSLPATHTTSAVPPDTRKPDVRRADALREKERLWETEARRYTEERLRCAALRRNASKEEERLRLIKQKEAAAAAVDLRRRRMKPTSRTLNFSLVPPVPQPPARFAYDFPFTTRAIPPPAPPRRSPQRQDEEHEPNRVIFPQVLACMHGQLFPELPDERMLSTSAKSHRERALLDLLLSPVDPNGKGKGRAEPRRCHVCVSPMPSPSTPSSASSGLSRAGSWLSFSGSSRSSTLSVSTAASSVPDSPLIPPSKAPMRLWLPATRRTMSPASILCNCPRESIRQLVDEHPLLPLEPPAPPRRPPHMSKPTSDAELPALPFTLALGRLVAMARNLQASYVRAVVVGYGGVSPDWEDTYWEEEPAMEKTAPLPHCVPPLASKLRLRPTGSRASRLAVREFLSSTLPATPSSPMTVTAEDELVPVARLSPLVPSSTRTLVVPRTQLPARLPYTTVFAAPLPLPRSPWAAAAYAGPRPATTGPVPCSVQEALERARRGLDLEQLFSEEEEEEETEYIETRWTIQKRAPVVRARAVPNSAFLRLKALHNETLTGLGLPTVARRPREAVLGLGVDRAPGSGLRFVYAREVVS
ncbi:hypothetical protein FB45DRAFT_1066079 [Roridomyces roridus]|uniref:Uncharacterized protein n=1 Tax=Roridomyces roridus TaxID=1738132 RepID=A0AAD7B662_9AGAR|nr:hypothetical protein FB45DRAFT_1066079 [Roridomyces roridus]